MVDEAVICVKCGRMVETAPITQQGFYPKSVQTSGLSIAAKVFMIIGTVIKALLAVISLAWCLPLTILYSNKLKNGKPVSTGFKVCSLLFVSVIGGILMLCDKNN